MKHFITIAATACLFAGSVQAQTWNLSGNSLSGTEALGSTNAKPLIFKTNNISRMTLDISGKLNLSSLGGGGSVPRFLQADDAGNVVPFSFGSASQVLYGTGQWGDLPASPITFSPSDGTSPNTYRVGQPPPPMLPPCYTAPANSYITQTNDMVQIFGNYAYSQNTSNVNRMSIGYDGVNDFIDGAGHNLTASTKPGLLLNYYCGGDVAICTNPSNTGGSNSAGGVVSVGQNLQLGFPGFDINTVLNVRANGSQTTLINAQNSSNTSLFSVAANGHVYIGIKKPIAGQHNNSLLSVFGDITTTALYVTDPTLKWADYVFDKNYRLMTLPELESYYKANGHLPNVPSTKEVQENGLNLAETEALLLQKVEELTLYVVQQQKEIERLKAEMQKNH